VYQKILAPLDGSELAECTLEHLRTLVLGCGIPEVVLLRVIEPLPPRMLGSVAHVTSDILIDMENEGEKEAQRYIRNIAKILKKEGINATPVLLTGHPAEEILNYANTNDVDLIIMSTHGRSGIKRLLMGSVTNKILSNSLVPILTIIPKGYRGDN
jgi:nucleotide-binding universal stress UspA family protein